MKKNYIIPDTQVIDVESEQIFASSEVEAASCTIEDASIKDISW